MCVILPIACILLICTMLQEATTFFILTTYSAFGYVPSHYAVDEGYLSVVRGGQYHVAVVGSTHTLFRHTCSPHPPLECIARNILVWFCISTIINLFI